MARPSGMCEGTPCYTSADLAAIDAELANANAERTDAAAVLQAAQEDYDAKEQAVMNLEMEKSTAEMNQCPC